MCFEVNGRTRLDVEHGRIAASALRLFGTAESAYPRPDLKALVRLYRRLSVPICCRRYAGGPNATIAETGPEIEEVTD
jgi:hypothetical protein